MAVSSKSLQLALLLTFTPRFILAQVMVVRTIFTIDCGAPLVEERIDPLLFPGTISPHVHMVAGGNAFDFTVSGDKLLQSTCSTCKLHPDKSAYWSPRMYYEEQNGTFVAVPLQNMDHSMAAYYRSGAIGPKGHKLTAFPPGFRMYTGNPMLRECQNPTNKTMQAIQMGCFGAGEGAGGQYYFGFPTVQCETIRLQMNFPNCWDGHTLESKDNSHVSFPRNGTFQGGFCPDKYPVPLITLFVEFGYNTKDLPFYSPTSGVGVRNQPFVLAQGDASGCGLHGDMISGWEGTALQDSIDYFVANFAAIGNSPPDTAARPSDGQPDYSGDCYVQPVLNTDVQGPMIALPGCNAITGIGPNASPVMDCSRNDNWPT